MDKKYLIVGVLLLVLGLFFVNFFIFDPFTTFSLRMNQQIDKCDHDSGQITSELKQKLEKVVLSPNNSETYELGGFPDSCVNDDFINGRVYLSIRKIKECRLGDDKCFLVGKVVLHEGRGREYINIPKTTIISSEGACPIKSSYTLQDMHKIDKGNYLLTNISDPESDKILICIYKLESQTTNVTDESNS